MLYNTDKKNPGRYTLKELIKKQRQNCNAELMMKWLNNQYLPSDRKTYSPFLYLQDLREILSRNKETLPQSSWEEVTIDTLTGGLPDEFNSLPIDVVLDACLDQLGVFDKKHLTLTFITKLGIWFTESEKREFNKIKDPSTGKTKNRLDEVRDRCDLNSNIMLRLDSESGLSYEEFRSMIHLKSKKYSELTINQLLTLRNKVLFRLEDEIDFHISQWEDRMKKILLVAEKNGYTINK